MGRMTGIKNRAVRAYLFLRFVIGFPKQVLKINTIIRKPSYYPEMARKTKKEMWLDNFKWLCRDRQLNSFYTSYGLDVKGFRNADEFIPHREFCAMRNRGNQANLQTITGNYNYIALLRDKYVFASYLSAAVGRQYVVDSIGIIDNGRVFICAEKSWHDLKALMRMDGNWVFKVIDGECGEGVFLVSIQEGCFFVREEKYALQEFCVQILKTARWLIQPVVQQHAALKAFGTKSVNTIRAVTIQGKSGAVGVFNAFLRLGADPDSFVDNRAMGGYGVGIDLETGKLMRYGYQHDHFGGKAEKHPLSGIVFDGYQLPFWKETVELICNAHKQFYELQSIGWDVVITESGPVLLEGNDDWEIGGPQDTYGGLKRKWNELVNA